MARITIVTLVDDLDGTPIEQNMGENVKFALDSVSYEIDLSLENAKALRDALEPFTKAGRPVKVLRASTGAPRSNPNELVAARSWLRQNGHQVSDRGRIPNRLMQLFRDAK